MNPNAKEFVPAHILKRRQEESERVNQITQQIGQVGIDDQENKTIAATTTEPSKNDTTTAATTTTTTTATKNASTTETSSTPNENVATSNGVGGDEKDDHDSKAKKTTTVNSNNVDQHQYTNGEKQDLDNEDDRYLLKGGEAFCEFNGEQFIIPGEDDDYEPSDPEQYRKTDFDFGNAEDNEDEDVCNAYEEFLDNLPE